MSDLKSMHCLILSLLVQGTLLVIDDFGCHRRRGLGNWERLGHPIDSLFFALPFGYAGWIVEAQKSNLIILSVLSCLIILKDEWVHAGRVSGFEGFLHASLFLIHPVTLYWLLQVWQNEDRGPIRWIALGLLGFAVMQFGLWNQRLFKWTR